MYNLIYIFYYKEYFRIFEKNNAKIVVDKTSLELLNGATVDYKEEMARSSFVIIDNPIAIKSCSCGSSFATK